MTIDEVFDLLAEHDIRLKVVMDYGTPMLRATNPKRLDDRMRIGLRQHKAQIIHEMQMPLLDYVLHVFGPCWEVDDDGRRIDKKPLTAPPMTLNLTD